MVGAQDQYVNFSGQAGAQAITTDTAVNIIAALQQAVAVAYKAQIASFGSGVNPPIGVPNLFNLSFTLNIVNNNSAAGVITLTGGAGVTITGTNTLAITTTRIYVVTVTSPTTVTMQNVGSGSV
jgi:hypothetical protein